MKKLINFILFFAIIAINLRFFSVKQSVFAVKKELTSAEGMVTIEQSTGRVLYEKDKDKRLPMASTTKILTAIVAIENTKDLDEKHEIPKEAVGVEGSSIYLKAGEHLTIRELLYGLMLRSGNDSAVAIAILVAGSVDEFVNLMNEFCEKLELENTHIVTVNGLHDANHYSSASDLARVTSYALKNETFAEIVGTKETKISNEFDKKNRCRFLKNKNKLLKTLDGATGVKTGYTTKAGRCFVGSATRNNMTVICVVLNCRPMFEETKQLIEMAFNEYKLIKLFKKGELTSFYPNDKKVQKISINIENDIYYPLNTEELLKINAKLVSDSKYYENSVLEFRIENNLIFSEKLYTILIYNKGDVKDNIHKIIKAFWYIG